MTNCENLVKIFIIVTEILVLKCQFSQQGYGDIITNFMKT